MIIMKKNDDQNMKPGDINLLFGTGKLIKTEQENIEKYLTKWNGIGEGIDDGEFLADRIIFI